MHSVAAVAKWVEVIQNAGAGGSAPRLTGYVLWSGAKGHALNTMKRKLYCPTGVLFQTSPLSIAASISLISSALQTVTRGEIFRG